MKTTLKEKMSPYPIAVHPDESLDTAYMMMKRENIRHLPVTDELGDLAGIISDRDFKRAMWPMSAIPGNPSTDVPNFQKGACVGDFMTSPAKCLADDSSLLEAVQLMIEKKISAVVIKRGEEITGIITHEDLLRVLADLLKKPASLKDKLIALESSPTLSRFLQSLSDSGI